jgi:hypothetical protein
MFTYSGDNGDNGNGEDPESACIDAGLEEFDLEPTGDESAINVFVNGDNVGIVTWQDDA